MEFFSIPDLFLIQGYAYFERRGARAEPLAR